MQREAPASATPHRSTFSRRITVARAHGVVAPMDFSLGDAVRAMGGCCLRRRGRRRRLPAWCRHQNGQRTPCPPRGLRPPRQPHRTRRRSRRLGAPLPVSRPPVPRAGARLALLPDGRICCTLAHPWSDGTRALLFAPVEFLEKLAVLVPRPPRGTISPGPSFSAGCSRSTFSPARAAAVCASSRRSRTRSSCNASSATSASRPGVAALRFDDAPRAGLISVAVAAAPERPFIRPVLGRHSRAKV
jgi:hypothetical protein